MILQKKELNRVRLSSSSSDTDDFTRPSTFVRQENFHKEEAFMKSSKAEYSDVDIEVDVDDSSPNLNIQSEPPENCTIERETPSAITQKTIGKPQIAPKKPMMMEKLVVEQKNSLEHGEHEELDSTKHCSSSVDWNMSVSSDENDELPSREGDKLVQKVYFFVSMKNLLYMCIQLQAEFNKCRSNSQSSQDNKDDFEEVFLSVILYTRLILFRSLRM